MNGCDNWIIRYTKGGVSSFLNLKNEHLLGKIRFHVRTRMVRKQVVTVGRPCGVVRAGQEGRKSICVTLHYEDINPVTYTTSE